MRRNEALLTDELLREAIAVSPAAKAPADLRQAVIDRVVATPQRAPSRGVRLSVGLGSAPRHVRIAVAFMLLAAIVVAAAAVGSVLLHEINRPLAESLTYRGDAARTGTSSATGPGGSMAARWEILLPDQIVTSPAVAEGTAYVPVLDGSLRAFDLEDGRPGWRADIGATFSSPSIAGNLILLGTDSRELVAVDRNAGDVVWRLPLDGFAAGSPAVVGTRAFVTTSSDEPRGRHDARATGSILAVDIPTQTIVWQEALPGPSTQSVAAAGSTVVAPTDSGIAVAFDQATGSERWRVSTAVSMDTPVITGDTVLLAGLDLEGTRGELFAVELETGRPRWHHRRPRGQTMFAPAVDAANGQVFVGCVDGEVVALRIADGTVAWAATVGQQVAASPALASGTLYVPTLGGIVTVDTGARSAVGLFATTGIPFTPAVAHTALLAGTTSGSLYQLVASGFASSPLPLASAGPMRSPPEASPSGPPIPRPLTEIWQRTAADLGLDGWFFMSGAPDGTLWIADSPRNRFVIVDPDGRVVDTWQPTGEAALDLVQPDADRWGAVAFMHDGGFVVTDTNHQRVLRFDAERRLVATWGGFGSDPGHFISPFGIAVGPDGLVYVVDDPTCRVQVFETSGAFLRTVAGTPELQNTCTNNVIVDAAGRVYLASGGRGVPWRIGVYERDRNAAQVIGEGLFREPVVLAPGPGGAIYATDGTDRLHLIGPDGTTVGSWSGTDLELAVIGPGAEIYATSTSGVLRRYEVP